MDSLQTLYSLLQTLYRLSTLYYSSLQTLYSHTAAVLQHCRCSAVQNIEVATGTTALQHCAALLRYCCGTVQQTRVC